MLLLFCFVFVFVLFEFRGLSRRSFALIVSGTKGNAAVSLETDSFILDMEIAPNANLFF